jgi:drug/metabolite transporter (DMT)-like permease
MHAGTQDGHAVVRGILLRLGAVAASTCMAACVKYLDEDGIPISQSIFVRCAISVAVLAVLAQRTAGLQLLVARNWRSHAWRSLSGTVGLFTWFGSLTLLPLADATAIVFTSPLFVTLLAGVSLGECVRRHHWIALALGFGGVMIMIGPHLSLDSARSSLGVLLALASAISAAMAMLFLRGMSSREHPLTITFYFSLTTLACAALGALGHWPVPTASQWLLILLGSVLGLLFQLLLTHSYRHASATTLASLEYTSMIMAVLIGYLVFGEVPGIAVWIGAPLVIQAGLLILWYEYRQQARSTASAR